VAEDLEALGEELARRRSRKNLDPPVTALVQWFQKIERRRNGRKFKSLFHMDHVHFEHFTSLIEGHEVFQNRSCNPQVHPRYQLAVSLYQLGNAGGTTHEDTSTLLGLGEGTVSLYSNRVLRAFHSLKDRFIKWPDRTERKTIAVRIKAESLGTFEDAVGFIDGTYIVLKYASVYDYYYYFNRKNTYALNATVVCDDRRHILWVRAGDTCAVHDARVFSRSSLSREPDDYFRPQEYLIGGSAYTPSNHMVPPFKKPRASKTAEARFNSIVRSQRVAIEHTFGQIKARFPFLTSVPIKIANLEDKSAW
jgi:hypothetical protein